MRRMIAAGPPANRPPHIGLAVAPVSGTARAAPGRPLAAVEARRCMSGVAMFARSWSRCCSPAADAAEPSKTQAGRVYPGDAAAASAGDRLHRHRRQDRQSGRFRAASRRSSICGRRGASPACGRCPRSNACRQKLGDRLTVAAISQDRGGDKVVSAVRRQARARQGQDLSRPEERGRPCVRGARPADQHRDRRRGARGRAGSKARPNGIPPRCWPSSSRCVNGRRDRDADEGASGYERAPLSTSRRKRPPRSQTLRIDRVLDAGAGQRLDRHPGAACSAASACARRLERHQRVLGAVDQQHRRARAQFAGQQLGGDQPAGIAEDAGERRSRGAGRQTATSSCPARTRPAPASPSVEAALLQFLVDIGVEDRRGGAHPGQDRRRACGPAR